MRGVFGFYLRLHDLVRLLDWRLRFPPRLILVLGVHQWPPQRFILIEFLGGVVVGLLLLSTPEVVASLSTTFGSQWPHGLWFCQ